MKYKHTTSINNTSMNDNEIINPNNSSYDVVVERIKDKRCRINEVTYLDRKDLSSYVYKSFTNNKVEFWLSREGLLLLSGYSRDGKSLNDIAKECGISYHTLYQWRRQYPQINQALMQTREVVIRTLENASLKSALGYTTTVIKPIVLKKPIKDSSGKIIGYEETVEYVAEEEFIKPEWNMQQFMLKNMAPDKYKGDAKQIAEALNQEKIEQMLSMQQAFQQALIGTASKEELEDEKAVVIDNDEY